MNTKIYVWCVPWPALGADGVMSQAVGADGQGLASHLSSDESWAKHDMGMNGNWKHDVYRAAYPDGYELEWVDDEENHKGLDAALELNHAKAKDNPSPPSPE